MMRRLVPDICRNIGSEENYARFMQLLRDRTAGGGADAGRKLTVLVVGGAIEGAGLGRFLHDPDVRFVESDIYFGPRTGLVCDAHDLAFADQTFDGVVIQAVLEHVADPDRCAQECFRVLKPGGLVYAESAFLQAVHEGRYDFMRFTDLGHRRLFRRFDEVSRGAVMGPGAVLAWMYRNFLLSFVTGRRTSLAVRAFAHYTSFWLKYFDYYLLKRPATIDGSCQMFFLGRRGDNLLSDRDLVKLYRGHDQSSVPL